MEEGDHMERSTVETRIRAAPRRRKDLVPGAGRQSFPRLGGGQPGDTGDLVGEEFLAEVRDGREEDGVVWLDVTCRRGVPREGFAVEARVDLARRFRLFAPPQRRAPAVPDSGGRPLRTGGVQGGCGRGKYHGVLHLRRRGGGTCSPPKTGRTKWCGPIFP